MKHRLFFLPSLLFLLAASALGQRPEEVVKWSGHFQGSNQASNRHSQAILTGTIASGWHVYSITQPPGGPNAAVVTVPAGQAFQLHGPITGTQPESAFDPNFQMKTEFYEHTVNLKVPLQSAAGPAKGEVRVDIRFQACNDRLCLPPKTVQLNLPVTGGEAIAVPAGHRILAGPATQKRKRPRRQSHSNHSAHSCGWL